MVQSEDLLPRTSTDARTLDAALARFGFRETFVRRWIAERVEAPIPNLSLYPEKPGDPRLRGWRWTHVEGNSPFGLVFVDPPTHFWIPRSGGYVAVGHYGPGGGLSNAPPGWLLTHKVSKTRLTFFTETDRHDDTVKGFGRVEAGWLPLPL